MSRITGSDAASLMEAYAAVYAPQELTEEQVWEEVENWVNSLVEEGYDLSEYTWEDMYEAYIEEQGTRRGAAPATSTTSGAVTTYAQPRPNTGQPYQSRFARPMNAGTPVSQGDRGGAAPSRVTRPQIGSLPASARQVTQYPAGVSTGVGGGNAGASSAPARPAAPAPAPRPAAPAPAPRPAAPAPAQGGARPTATPATTTAPATTTPAAAPVRTPNPLMQKTFGYQTGQAPSQIAATRAATTTAASNLSGTGALAVRPTATATPAPSTSKPNLQQQIRQRRLNMDLDLFDIVQGYLLDEGYAETEEAAAVIMANMSEEWKTQIIESGYFPTKESQREDEAKYKKGSSEVKHRTAQTQARPTPSK
jgi:hypothetical protein